ncbi:MAG TPA: hypothetical protein VIL64_03690 [Solirubrobacteraceae bacterium]
MKERHVTSGEVLAALAGAVLIADLFAPWYRHGATGDTALHAFSVVLGFLIVTGLLGIALLVTTFWQRSVAVPVGIEVWLSVISLVTTIIVIVRLLDPPGGGHVRWGAWVGLACAAGVFLGAGRALRAESRD